VFVVYSAGDRVVLDQLLVSLYVAGGLSRQ
jgi:hypothetical protein